MSFMIQAPGETVALICGIADDEASNSYNVDT